MSNFWVPKGLGTIWLQPWELKVKFLMCNSKEIVLKFAIDWLSVTGDISVHC